MAVNDKNLPGAYLDQAPSTYGQQMSNVGSALLGVLANAGRFLVSAPGSGSPFAAGAPGAPVTAPVSPTVTNAVNAATLANADASSVQATAPQAAKPAAAAGTGAARAPAAPAIPAAPKLIPGETGYFNEANQLVPYGVNLAAGVPAAGAAPRGLPTGAANLIDPRGYLNDTIAAQLGFARRAADDILAAAGSGSDLGYSARLRALTGVYNNGLAQTGMGGVNNFNTDISRILGSQLSADAQRAAASIGAGTASADRAAAREDQMFRFANSAQVIGTDTFTDPLTRAQVTRNLYGMPNMKGGFSPLESPGSTTATKPKEGATGKTPDGRAVVYKNGTWTEK